MPESHSSLKPLLIGVGLTSLTLSAATLISAWIGSTILLRRRTPDPADLPSNYGLEYSTVNFPARDGTPPRTALFTDV